VGILDLFSKRQHRARGEVPDVFEYDKLPQQLRVQIVHIIRDAFGSDHFGQHHASETYKFVRQSLCREYGVFELIENPQSEDHSVFNFFLREESIERALDVVELCFQVINNFIRGSYQYRNNTHPEMGPDDAVTELNERFKEHGVGYRFESNVLIRVDSEFLHAEAIKPALTLLRGDAFKGANDEFLGAHEHYRHGRYKECLVDSLKAFESTMKAICQIRGWTIQTGDTAKTLISTCMSNGLLPQYLCSQFSSLRSLLESGIPTIRNRNGGHGQGTDPIVVPEYLARYALNLTATTILFFVEANSVKK
jgi:hypothetical protein